MLEITDLKYASSNMPVIKVIGVGGCGNNAVNRLSHETPFPIHFIAINTDQMVLDKSNADICLTIGKKLTNGFGAGGNPEIAYAAAEESTDEWVAGQVPVHFPTFLKYVKIWEYLQ